MMGRSINWFGLSAGIITLIVLVISFYVPWWQLTIGQNLIKINASPVNTNFGLFGGAQFTIPLIWALNLISILTFTACGLVMLIYSLNPTKSYSKHLLGFSYKKPLYVLIFFAVGLVAIVIIAGFLRNEYSSHGLSNPYFADAIHLQRSEHQRFSFGKLSIALLPCNSSCRIMHRSKIIP